MRRLYSRTLLLAIGIGCAAALLSSPSFAHEGDESCGIEGPSTVDAGQSFTLCAPTTKYRKYEWEGPGIRGDRDERCLEVRGMSEGTYTYRLKTRVSRSTTKRCTFTITVLRASSGSSSSCLISGPTTVPPNVSFTLCAPTADGYTWRWSGGSGLPTDRTTRCVTVNGLSSGHYAFELEATRNGVRTTCRHVVSVRAGTDSVCLISGPSAIGTGESFELCGPTGFGYTYGWSGTGTPADSNDRCLTIDSLSAGTHEFTLRLGGPQGTRVCTFSVQVFRRNGNGFDFGCPRPLSFWKRLCGNRDRDRDRDRDSAVPAGLEHGSRGSGAISPQDLDRILACFADHTDVFSWSNGDTSLCDLFDSRQWNGSGKRSSLRRQFAVFLLNHCAGSLGIRDAGGNAIGNGFDPLDQVSCRRVDAASVEDLIDQLNDLLGGTSTHRLALEDGWRRRDRDKQIERWADCLEDLNGGSRACRGRNGDGHDDDDDDDLTAGSLEAAGVGGEIALERPMPNPFAQSTRMMFAVERDGTPVSIGVYDLAGRVVRRLANETRSAGIHEIRWDAIDASGTRVRPGVYFVRGTIGDRPMSVRVMYVK